MAGERSDSLTTNEEQNKVLVKSLNELTETIKSKQAEKSKDTWDKFGAVSPLVTGLVVAIVGGMFTYFESARNDLLRSQEEAQKDRQETQDALNRDHQARILELQTIAQFMPYLTGKNEDSKQVAITAINTLSNTKLAIELAKLNKSPGTIRAVEQIASQSTSEGDRKLAQAALVELTKGEGGGPNRTLMRTEEGNCGPEGSGGDSQTNVLKNRTDVPSTYQDVTIDILKQMQIPTVPFSREQWTAEQSQSIKELGEQKSVRIQGFLIRAVKEAQTTANCRFSNYTDWHLNLGPSPDSANIQTIVSVAGPRIRLAHPNWTLEGLRKLAATKSAVRVSGWLYFDQQHLRDFRRFVATTWEVRPVVKIEYLQGEKWNDLDATPP